MSTKKYLQTLQNSFIFGIGFFLTVCALSIGYSAFISSYPATVGTGSGLSSTQWNKIVSGLQILDTNLSNFSFSGTNVGIGTTAPGTKLQIVGTNSVPIVANAGTSGYWGLTHDATGDYGMFAGVSNTGDGWIQEVRTNALTYYNLLLQPSGGNVGIGTASPQATLDVNGTVKATNFSGLANSFVMIQATATVGSASPGTWTGNASCPAWYTIVFWGSLSSAQYWGGGMTHWYAQCLQNGNGIQANLYTQVGYVGHYLICSGLCVK